MPPSAAYTRTRSTTICPTPYLGLRRIQGRVHAGDLVLYESNTLVLFYRTFTTSYSYTALAKVDDPARLAAALGMRNVTVTFSR